MVDGKGEGEGWGAATELFFLAALPAVARTLRISVCFLNDFRCFIIVYAPCFYYDIYDVYVNSNALKVFKKTIDTRLYVFC